MVEPTFYFKLIDDVGKEEGHQQLQAENNIVLTLCHMRMLCCAVLNLEVMTEERFVCPK